VRNVQVYRDTFGFEKTFDDGHGSFGVRLPLNTLSADITGQPGGATTSLGNPSFFAKYVLKADPATGFLASAGLVLTPAVQTGNFAGSRYFQASHSTSLQPFLGYLWSVGDLYVHGFSSFDAPVSPGDAMMLYNDVGVGYFLLRRPVADRVVTAFAPTFEVHVNTPLNHNAATNPYDPSAMYNTVDLTFGANVELFGNGVLTLAYVAAASRPRPFGGEAVVLLNFRYGRSRIVPRPLAPMAGP
jgi:hypothetical protein